MRLMTWNLLEGGADALLGPRHALLADVLRAERPDVLVACEARDLSAPDEPLSAALREAGLAGHSTTGGDPGFEVAILVRAPFVLSAFDARPSGGPIPFAVATLSTPMGSVLRVIGAHFHHLDPLVRETQAARAASLAATEPALLLGDLNGLAHADALDAALLDRMPPGHRARHEGASGAPATGATRLLEAAGLVDAWRHLAAPGSPGFTVPTDVPAPARFAPMRLDYIFITAGLVPCLKACRVVRDGAARMASDHFPLVVDLEFP